MGSPTMPERMHAMVRRAQTTICAALEAYEKARFQEDAWRHGEGGGGTSRVLQGGTTFDKAGVNVAAVCGTLGEEAIRVMLPKEDLPTGPLGFTAVGLSLVIHPRSPWVPTIHCNYRYFELDSGRWWFGGGSDLTPVYLFDDDACHFHGVLAAACGRHDPAFYPRFKRWCDEYFTLAHRGERRGVGGIFFDELRDRDPESLLAFVTDCADSFLDGYLPILERRLDRPYGERELRWQGLRRGRYVEFNLMYDRGTRFGLRTGGRVESILMSLPLSARWEYGHEPEPGSAEAATLAVLRTPREWV
ncbi:MAG TPA: oxygen-dependent coproporphyrinogen oxidase [Thermoanaerobaculia bacterium]|nr:oxygen-dependent coproporphyrinogen oxidase [Thermoanaerobaculia bacterium]